MKKQSVKYAIIANEVIFGTLNQLVEHLYNTKEEAQAKIDDFAKNYMVALRQIRPTKKYTLNKEKNIIYEDGNTAVYFDILTYLV